MKTLVANVVALSSPQTIKVEMMRSFAHPKYKKIINRTISFLVHNEVEGIAVGDQVKITQCRPYSKRKQFLVLEKVK